MRATGLPDFADNEMSPAQRLRILLEQAAHDRIGFAQVWPSVTQQAVRGCPDRDEWLAAFAATRRAWQRAYTGRPARRAEVALALIARDHTAPSDGVDRWCGYCDKPLTGRPQQMYCDRRCRQNAHNQRARLALAA